MLYDCPECALPCTVEPRGWCASTGGPVEVVFVRCANRHWFLGPADRLRRLASPASAPESPAGAPESPAGAPESPAGSLFA